MNHILALENVELAPPETKYYFNGGNVEKVRNLQQQLKKDGVDLTVLCHAPPHDPNNVYYTPKNARMVRGGWQADEQAA